MNKKVFLRNKPFDENDANEMQDWIESSLTGIVGSIFSPGIITGLDVVAVSNLNVKVNPGKAYDSNYKHINMLNSQNLTLPTADSSNPRIDIIVVKFKTNITNTVDTADKYGYGPSFIYSQNILDSFELQIVKGVANSSPTKPSTPAGSILLASINIPKLATSIFQNDITDERISYTIGDNFIGKKSINDGEIPSSNYLFISEALSSLANRIKAITGKDDWKSNPQYSIKDLVLEIEKAKTYQ